MPAVETHKAAFEEVPALLERSGAGVWTAEAGNTRCVLTRDSDGMRISLSEANITRPMFEIEIDWDRDVRRVEDEFGFREWHIDTKLRSYLFDNEIKGIKDSVRSKIKDGARGIATAIVMDLLPANAPLVAKATERHERSKAMAQIVGGDAMACGYGKAKFGDKFPPMTTHIWVKGQIDDFDRVALDIVGLTDDQAKRVLTLLAELAQEKTREPHEDDE